MRIENTRSTSGAKSTRKTASSADASAFEKSLNETSGPERTAAAAPAAQLSSVAALMALQATEDPLERKRRAERRGRQMLDGLDRLKLDVLEDRDPIPTLLKLRGMLESSREDSGDSQLEALIDQVELRVEVELAKRLRR